MSAAAVQLPAVMAVREEPRLRAVPHASADAAVVEAPPRDLLVPSLDDVVSRMWEALLTAVPVACIVCGGAVEQHVCTSCGSALE